MFYKCYLGAFFRSNIAISVYITSGIIDANIGRRFPFMAKELNIFISKINEKANPIPNARFNPVPPLVFLQDRDTPIRVRIIYAIGLNNLWYFSTLKSLTTELPLTV